MLALSAILVGTLAGTESKHSDIGEGIRTLQVWQKDDQINAINESQILVLDFFAHWCISCRSVSTKLVQFEESNRNKQIRVIPINVEALNPEKTAQFMKRTGLSKAYFDSDGLLESPIHSMKPFNFKSKICRVESAMDPHGVPVPDYVSKPLREAGIKRLIIWINGYELKHGLQGSVEFGSHLVVRLSLLKEAGVALDDEISVTIEADPEPNAIDVYDEFLIALEQDPDAMTRWAELTPGKQRSIAHHVSSAKPEETRIKRAIDLAMKLRTRTLHGD